MTSWFLFRENGIPGSKLGKRNSPFGYAWASLICGKLGAIAKVVRIRHCTLLTCCRVYIIILGDFNRLNISRLKYNYNLRQLINFPTLGKNTLDLVLTNLHKFYGQPVKCAPFGLSDHMSVELKPKYRSQLQKVHKLVVWKRDLRPSSRFAFRKYLELLDIPNMFDKVVSCEGKSSLLETIITTGLNFIMPLRPTTVRCNEPPLMNPELSTLITKCQKALNQGNTHKFKNSTQGKPTVLMEYQHGY